VCYGQHETWAYQEATSVDGHWVWWTEDYPSDAIVGMLVDLGETTSTFRSIPWIRFFSFLKPLHFENIDY
jgi:hypothetical protein